MSAWAIAVGKDVANRCWIVPDNAHANRHPAEFADRIGQNLRIAVVNLPRLHGFSRGDDLVSGRYDRDAGHPPDIRLGQTDGREHSGFATGDQIASAKDGLSDGDVGTGEGDPETGGNRSADEHGPIVVQVAMFDHGHGIGTAGDHRSGRNGDRLAGADLSRAASSRSDGAVRETNRAGSLLVGSKGVGRLDRESVVVRPVERRHVDLCHDVARENSAEQLLERNELFVNGREFDRSQKPPLGFVSVEDLKKLLLHFRGSCCSEREDRGK